MSINPPRRQRGLSLVELIIFMVVMGIAAVIVLQLMNYASTNSANPALRKQALLLAESYLEEVELARFTYCDPVDPAAPTANSPADCTVAPEIIGQEAASSVGRPYDNVSDYVTQAGAPQQNFKNAAGYLSDVNGNSIDPVRLAGFTVTVALNVVPQTSPLGPGNTFWPAMGGLAIWSSTQSANMNALRITVQVKYGGGSTAETVTLDGYRTRYAPRAVP